MPALTTAFAQGVAASRPAAATSNSGYVYFATDTGILSQSTGSSWTTIGPAVALDALTTKGDLLTRTSSAYSRLGVGSDAQVLTADSTQSTGVKWATPAGGYTDPLTTRGDLVVRGASSTGRLALGTSGYYLKSDGTDAAWAAASAGTVKQILHAQQTADNTNISSVALADYPNLSQAITVGGSGSNSVVVELSGSFQSSANSTFILAIKLGGTTVYLGAFYSTGGNATGVHGIAAFDSVAAGAATVQPRYLSSGGGIYCRPITANPTQERMHLLVTEYAN